MKDEIILNNLKLIDKVIFDLHLQYKNKEEYEDYYQIGLIGLAKSAKTFNQDKKSTYLYKGIKNELLAFLTTKSRHKRNDYLHIELNNDINIELISSNLDLEKQVLDKMYIEYLLSKIKNKKNKYVIENFYGINCIQKNETEIAKELNVTHQMIHTRRKQGLKELKEIIEKGDKENE